MAGRPTKYQAAFVLVARTMSLEGSCQATIARALGVAPPTLHGWAAKHPEFGEAMRAADHETGKVVVSVLKMAKGYTRKTVRPITVSIGNGMSEIVDHPIIEYFPPNLAAALRWLKVHRPAIWGDAGHGTVKQEAPQEDVSIPAGVLRMLTEAAQRKAAGS